MPLPRTLACGTGAVADALVASALGKAKSPVEVVTKGGDTLVVSFKKKGPSFSELHLEGEVVVVCEGHLYA